MYIYLYYLIIVYKIDFYNLIIIIMNKEKIEHLLEAKLHNIFNKIEKRTNIKYNDILKYVDDNIFKTTILTYKSDLEEIKKYLKYLLLCDKSYLELYKNLNELQTRFKILCEKKKMDTTYITIDFIHDIVVEHYNYVIGQTN